MLQKIREVYLNNRLNKDIAQSGGAVEYTDSFSAEKWEHPPPPPPPPPQRVS